MTTASAHVRLYNPAQSYNYQSRHPTTGVELSRTTVVRKEWDTRTTSSLRPAVCKFLQQ